MRVMHLELGRHLYGGAKQVVYLIEAIDAQNAGVEQLLVCAEGSDIASLNLPCDTHALPYAGDIDVSMTWRLTGLIRATKPDILHIHSRRGADLWGAMVAWRAGIPAVCTRRVDNVESWFNKLKYQQYKAVISISHGVQKVVSAHCPPTVYQQVIHSAVALSEFSHPPDPDWFRRTFDVPEGYKVIANFAQLIGRKGQSEIISAMKEVVQLHPKTLCLLFGKGRLSTEYQKQITALNLQDNVRLCGFTEQVARILPNIDLMVHPAHAEGLGVILLQAGACKVPVIASPAGGIPEIVLDKKTGWLTPAGEPNLLAHTVIEALENSPKRLAMGNALFEHVNTNFSTTTMANDYIRLYGQILS